MAKANDEKAKGLYENWLKNFTLNVMIQSFHAFFLLFIMQMLSAVNYTEIQDSSKLKSGDGLLAIMSIVGMMALIKFEKLIKDLFGIKDSMAGSAKASGIQAFAGLKAAGNFANEVKKPIVNYSKSKRNMTNLGRDLQLSDKKMGHYIKPTDGVTDTPGATGGKPITPPLSTKTQDLYEKMKTAKKDGDMGSYNDYRDRAVNQMKSEKLSAIRAAGGTGGAGSSTGGGAGSSTGGLTGKEQEYNQSVYDHRRNARKALAHSAINMAAMTMGMGATDTWSEAVKAADVINNPMISVTNRYIDHGENIVAGKSTGDTSRFNERTISEAIKQGFEHATVNARNDNGKINPVKLTVQAAVSYGTLPFKAVKNTVKASKVDNVDNL